MKKKILSAIILLTLASFLVACGSQEEPEVKTPDIKPETTLEPDRKKSDVTDGGDVAGVDDKEAVIIAALQLKDAFYATANDSNGEYIDIFYEMCLVYCRVGGQTDDVIEQMGLPEEMGQAFAKVAQAHGQELMDGYLQEEFLLNCDNLAEMFNEFMSYMPTEEAGNATTALAAFTQLKLEQNTLYNEGGVTITYDGCETADYAGSTTVYFTLVNNNPDNKKVSFGLNSMNVNGIALSPKGALYAESVESGKTVSMNGVLSLNSVDKVMEVLGTNIAETPIQTVGFDFSVRIGSNSDVEFKSAILEAIPHADVDMESLFGNYITSVEVEGSLAPSTVDIYAKWDERGLVVVLKTDDCHETSLQPYVSLQANEISLNAEDLTGKYKVIYPSGYLLLYVNATEDEMRRQCEIGNSEPLCITMRIGWQDTIVTLFEK